MSNILLKGIAPALITPFDKDGNILGNLPTEKDNEGNPLDTTFSTYIGLKEFTDEFLRNYDTIKDSLTENIWVMPGVSTTINKWMIGKVLYTDTIYTAEEIFSVIDSSGNNSVQDFKIAIAAQTQSGQVRIVQNSSRRQDTAEDIDILKPLTIRNG